MINYLTELSVIHLTLFLGYWLFLRKEQQYAKMRFYLLGATILALTIPLIRLPKIILGSKESIDVIFPQAISLEAMTVKPAVELTSWNYNLLIWIYIIVSFFFLVKFVGNVLHLINLERKSSHEKFNGLFIRKLPNISGSFTFFNWVFLSDQIESNSKDYEAILRHEKAHVSLGHTYDLVFFELFKVCFWWLPTAWLGIREIKKIHEYQADFHALRWYDIDQYSSILISSILKSNGLSLASSFHDGLIFKRLKAMKKQVKNVSPWKLGALASLCMILFLVFACSEEPLQKGHDITDGSKSIKSNTEEEVFTVVEEQPVYPGGLDALYRYVMSEIKYPKEARTSGVEGRVMVQFVVEKDGSISNVKAIEGIGAGCDLEAVRVLQKASSFSPGSQRGKKVRVRMVMPIIFRLDQEKRNPDNSTQGLIVVEKIESNKSKLKVDANYTDGAWSGTIYSTEGDVLPGANIVVAGTSAGTVSDLDGTFTVKASEGQDIQISFVGYESVRLLGKTSMK